MPRSHTLRRKFRLRSREFLICARVESGGIQLTLAEAGRATSEVHVSLDTAAELCDVLLDYDAYYREYRPLPERGAVLKRSRLVTADGAYLLELAVDDYRQRFTVTQDKERRTRSPPPAMSVPDMRGFRRALVQVVDQLSEEYLPLYYYSAGERGVTKMVRGGRVAVLYCPARAWPWRLSEHAERLLFEPELVRMILDKQEPAELQRYCERRYPDLVAGAREDGVARPVLDEFKCLSVRWVRMGAEFRVHRPERPGRVVLRHEDRWFTA